MIEEAFVDGSVYMDEAAHRRLKELVSPEGELSFLGEKSFPLLRMGAIISGMHGSGVSSFEGMKLLDYFSSRITEPGSGGDVIIKAFLDNPDKTMGNMVQVLEKAGMLADLPACAVKDFPDGCFLALARTLQEDFPLWGNSKILEVCKEFERQTDYGCNTVRKKFLCPNIFSGSTCPFQPKKIFPSSKEAGQPIPCPRKSSGRWQNP